MDSAPGISIDAKCPPTLKALLFPQRKTCQQTGRGREEQQELFPPNCLQDSFGTMSTVRSSTRYSQCHHLKKLKTFSVESYITDQQFTKFLYEENKCCPVFLPLISSLDRNPRNHISELVRPWLLATCVGCLYKQRLKPVGTECFLWGWFGISSEKWKILEWGEHQA